jgi:hypothetical protein
VADRPLGGGVPAFEAGTARVGYGELLVIALPAACLWVRMASGSFRSPQILSYGIWGYVAAGAVGSLLLARWWPLVSVVAVVAVVAYLSVLISLSTASAGLG